MKAKKLRQALVELTEEGVVQLFRPPDGSAPRLGVAGVPWGPGTRRLPLSHGCETDRCNGQTRHLRHSDFAPRFLTYATGMVSGGNDPR